MSQKGDLTSNDELDELADITKYKLLTLETAEAMQYTLTLPDKSKTVFFCGTLLGFNADRELISANFCRERFCPMCQRRKALRTYANISRLSEALEGEFSFLHLVLTVRNVYGSELNDCIDKLYKSSSKMFKAPRFKQGVKGVLRCLEVSYNADNNTYHPHLHCLCAVRKSYFTSRYYLKQAELREMWADALGVDYLPEVSVQKCDEGAIAEVAKYCVKPLKLDLPVDLRARVLDTLNRTLKSRRLLQTYGVVKDAVKALKIDLECEDDPQPSKEVKAFYSFDYRKNSYTESQFNILCIVK